MSQHTQAQAQVRCVARSSGRMWLRGFLGMWAIIAHALHQIGEHAQVN